MLKLLQELDGNILLFIQEHIRQPWMDGFWKAVTHLGDAPVCSGLSWPGSFCSSGSREKQASQRWLPWASAL